MSLWDEIDAQGAEQHNSTQQPSSVGQPSSPSLWDDVDSAATIQAQGNTTGHIDMLNPQAWGEERTVNFSTLVKAGLTDRPESRLNLLAEQLGVSPDAIGKYGDDLVYQDPLTRKMHRIGPADTLTAGGKVFLTDVLGKAPTITGAMTGAAYGSRLHPVAGTILGGMAGATGGELVRQGMGAAAGEEKTLAGVTREVTKEGLIEALGGGALVWGTRKFLLRRLARDIAKLDKVDTTRIADLSKKHGIQLTPAELTGLNSLISQQQQLMSFSGSADALGAFKAGQNSEIERAINNLLDSWSMEDSVFEANKRGIQTANKSIGTMKAERTAAAKPLYEQAYGEAGMIDITAIHKEVSALRDGATGSLKASSMKSAYQGVLNDLSMVDRKTGDLLTPKISLEKLDLIKKDIDDLANSAFRNNKSNRGRLLSDLAQKVRTFGDDASKTYKEARDAFAGKSPAIKEVEEGVVGDIAKLKDKAANDASRILFDSKFASPENVLRARLIIAKADPEAWNGLVKARLKTVLEKQVEGVGNFPKNVRKAMFGSESQRKVWKAALDKDQYQALNDLMDVLAAAERTNNGQSWTAMAQVGVDDMKREGVGLWSKIKRATVSPQRISGRIAEGIEGRAFEKHTAKLAEIITSPEGMKKLKQLKMLTPRQDAFNAAWTAFVAELGGQSVGHFTQGDVPMREDADYIKYINQNTP